MKIEEESFAEFNGDAVEQYTLDNGNGVVVASRSVLSPGDKYSEKTVYKFSLDPGRA